MHSHSVYICPCNCNSNVMSLVRHFMHCDTNWNKCRYAALAHTRTHTNLSPSRSVWMCVSVCVCVRNQTVKLLNNLTIVYSTLRALAVPILMLLTQIRTHTHTHQIKYTRAYLHLSKINKLAGAYTRIWWDLLKTMAFMAREDSTHTYIRTYLCAYIHFQHFHFKA